MAHDTEDQAVDIAWMRQLAQEGADAPMRGASALVAAGVIFGIASLAHWSVASGLVALEPPAFSALWGVATVVFLLTLAVLALRRRRQGGVVTVANRASGAVWSGVGIGIFFLGISMAVVGARLGEGPGMAVIWLLPSVIMVFYGLGWAVTAAMLKSRPLWWLAAGSFLAAPLLAVLAGEAVLYLAYAAALFLLMALPGWLLMRGARRRA